MSRDISNTEDTLDSRDIIERIKELESMRDDLEIEDSERGNMDNPIWRDWEESSEAEELKVLLALQSEGEGSPDWSYGETLIRDSYFEEYAQELAEELDYIKKDVHWPYTCIDWERAAQELQYDYFTIDFDGVDYWIRA